MTLTAIPVNEHFSDMNLLAALDREAFPPSEYISAARLIAMSQKPFSDLWAYYDGDTFVGFMHVVSDETLAYLFFLATRAAYRSRGYGRLALQKLAELYPDRTLVVDMEAQDANAENSAQRVKRRAFYESNGFCPTGYGLLYYGVPLEVMQKGDGFSIDALRSLAKKIDLEGFDPIFYEIETSAIPV